MSVPPVPRPPPGPTPRSRAPRWLPAVVLAVATLAFLSSLGGGFLADDFVYIARFRLFPWSDWPALFTHDWSGGVWGSPLRELRPFAALSFMGDARLFGGDPLGYRLTNLALHLFATAFVGRLAWRYTAGNLAGTLAAGLIFALHPAHAEAVGWITGRVDLQATAAALLYWLCAEAFGEHGGGRRLVLALLAFFLGIFSKELCMFAPLLLLLRWLLLEPRAPRPIWLRRAAVLGGTVALLVVYGACRRAAFGHDSIGYNLWTDEPAWHRQAGYAGWLLPVLPFTAQAEWPAFPALGTLHAIWLGLAVATVLALAVALRRRAHLAATAVFFGGVWYLLTVFPLTGVVYFSPRHLYFPTVGLALAAGCWCAAVRWRAVLAAVLVIWCAAAHFAALQPWRLAAGASRTALAALDRELALSPPGTVALSAVPETLGPAWLWAWSSPQNVNAPFLAHPPAQIIERPVNAVRSDTWMADRRPIETLRAAPAAVALHVAADGTVSCRRVPRAELAAATDKLAGTVLTPESLTAWIRSLAQPSP